jgi:phosphoribosylaminoimidazolecarboxamide formyltransferase/IMP cyclohydrolase
MLSTGGTAKALTRRRRGRVVDVSAYTGSPEILDGRVKTLHPKMHGGLLGRANARPPGGRWPSTASTTIDLVVVNLYPFEATIAKAGVTFEDEASRTSTSADRRCCARRQEPRAGRRAWSTRTTTRASSPSWRRRRRGHRRASARAGAEGYAHTSAYDAAIAAYLSSVRGRRGRRRPSASAQALPDVLSMQYQRLYDLRYGENAHQQRRVLPSTPARRWRERQRHARPWPAARCWAASSSRTTTCSISTRRSAVL